MKNPECRARKGIEKRELTDAEKSAGYVGALKGQIPYNSDSGELRDRGLNSGRTFIERMAPDCFKRSVADDADQMGFAGHTDDPLSAFARAGVNLTFTESRDGLAWEALVPDTAAGKDLMRLVDTKIIRGASFEFNVEGSGEKWEKRDGKDVRTITAARLYTVNPVAWPAYNDSDLTVSLRSGRGGDRRDTREERDYNPYLENECWNDGSVTVDAVFARNALYTEIAELTDAQNYLRACPEGVHAEYARAEVAESGKNAAAMLAWLTANGATVDPEFLQRANQAVTEARAAAKPAAAPAQVSQATDERELRRLEAFTIAPLINA